MLVRLFLQSSDVSNFLWPENKYHSFEKFGNVSETSLPLRFWHRRQSHLLVSGSNHTDTPPLDNELGWGQWQVDV